jgi:hypothetical protein
MVHEEPSYVVRRANGTTFSFPAWMTEETSADAKIVDKACLSLDALIELRRLTTKALSSMHSIQNEGECDEETKDTAEKPFRQSSANSYPSASGGGKVRGDAPADGVDASHGENHRCGGER